MNCFRGYCTEYKTENAAYSEKYLGGEFASVIDLYSSHQIRPHAYLDIAQIVDMVSKSAGAEAQNTDRASRLR